MGVGMAGRVRRMCRGDLGLWAFWIEPASLTVSEHTLNLPWPGERPLRVAVLTDLHVGSPFNGMDKLHSTVDRTNAAKPDIICILGDLGGRPRAPQKVGGVGIESVEVDHRKWRIQGAGGDIEHALEGVWRKFTRIGDAIRWKMS